VVVTLFGGPTLKTVVEHQIFEISKKLIELTFTVIGLLPPFVSNCYFRNREVYILLGATIVLYLTYIFIKRAYLNACTIYATRYLCSSASKNKKMKVEERQSEVATD